MVRLVNTFILSQRGLPAFVLIILSTQMSFAKSRCGVIVHVNDIKAKIEVNGKRIKRPNAFVPCSSQVQVLKVTSKDKQVFVRTLPSLKKYKSRVRKYFVVFGSSNNRKNRNPASFVRGANKVVLVSDEQTQFREEFIRMRDQLKKYRKKGFVK